MLEIKDFNFSYSNSPVLRGINLNLKKSEILALTGESGAGKTTLALAIMGLLSGQASGSIIYEGRNLLALPQTELWNYRWNKISMVFQDLEGALNPVLTVGKQVMEPMLEHRLLSIEKAKEKTKKLFKYVGLPEGFCSAYPHNLSGGEKQRVLIAMALSNDPEILIFDEPTSAVDAITRLEIIKIIKKASQNKAILLITHDLTTAYQLADRAAVMYAGRIMELGTGKEIFKEPKHPYTRGLLRSYPTLSTTKDLQGIPGKQEIIERGCPFQNRCTQKIADCGKKTPRLKQFGGRQIACLRGGIVSLLEGENIFKKFGETTALKGVDISLAEGETLALVGESGSGKTTLAKCIMGLEKPDGGKIIFQGKETKERNKELYKDLQLVFQNPRECISHRLNVLETVMEPLNIQRIGTFNERKENAKKALKNVELSASDQFLGMYAHHLSGGEIQRIAIARALVLNPRVLIADEPTSSLDASIQAKIVKLLLKLQEEKGLAMIFITHDIALARKISDRIVVLLGGEKVEEGPTGEIFAKPRHPYTRDLLKTAPNFSPETAYLKPPKNRPEGACVYASRCAEAGEICIIKRPAIFKVGMQKVRCHLYSRNEKEVLHAVNTNRNHTVSL